MQFKWHYEIFVKLSYHDIPIWVFFINKSGGLYRNDDPDDVIEENFRRWANRAIERNYVALFFDSFTPRGGKDQASEVTVRPYDVNASTEFLLSGYIEGF